MARANQRDANEQEIVDALRAAGATVVRLEPSEPGLPDLLIGFQEETFLQEVKNPRAKNQLSYGQIRFHRLWRGRPIVVVHTPLEALRDIGAVMD